MKPITHPQSRQETEKHPHQILAENPLKPLVFGQGGRL